MGEALLRHHLQAQGVDAHVHSAGTMRWRGRPTDEAILTAYLERERATPKWWMPRLA